MTILELCEPLFKKVCLLNRFGRKGGAVSYYDKLRLEIEELFKELERVAASDPLLKAQWQKVEFPLTFFVDSMIAESELPDAAQWHQHRLAGQPGVIDWLLPISARREYRIDFPTLGLRLLHVECHLTLSPDRQREAA